MQSHVKHRAVLRGTVLPLTQAGLPIFAQPKEVFV
jgi:hypothetical protein